MVDIIPSSQLVIGHGAFSIVYRAKLKSAPSNVVAIKAITKKNLAKSQNLLGKEIKILAVEQSHNIVMVKLSQLLQDLDLLPQQVLALRQVLLCDRLDRYNIAWCRFQPAFVDDRKGAVPDQVLGIELVDANVGHHGDDHLLLLPPHPLPH